MSPLSDSPPSHDTHHGWDKAIHSFLLRIGFTQAANGFVADLLVMNSTWEEINVPRALKELQRTIFIYGLGAQSEKDVEFSATNEPPPLGQRKLDYVHLANNVPARTPSTINKEISLFLARNRARNDASNRAEFVYTPSQKQKRPRVEGDDSPDVGPGPSCARVDAKPVDRDEQMKYDIAKNQEGPLNRTMAVEGSEEGEAGDRKGKQKAKVGDTGGSSFSNAREEDWTAAKHPGLDERLRNVEAHLAVRYVPSAPRTLLSRLKFLEEHLIHLEKEYPPWAALHFKQPNRGWPPPPHQTPIIVPPHLRPKDAPLPSPDDANFSTTISAIPIAPSGKRMRKTESSLHRAVMERLEVKQAMSDLA